MKEAFNSRPNPLADGPDLQSQIEATQQPHNIDYGDNSLPILTQEEGLSALNRFLQRQAGFETLGILKLDVRGERYRENNGVYRFYLGLLEEGNNQPICLRLNLTHHLGYVPEHAYAIPRIAHIGNTPYYWLEFREEISGNTLCPPFLSVRLRPDQPVKKIDQLNWRGLEEQLLVDFIRGENGIKVSDLKQFSVKVSPNRNSFCLGGEDNLRINLKDNPRIMDVDELWITPRKDPQNIYTWIEINRKDQDEDFIMVSKYLILPDEKRIKGWRCKSVEAQYFLDYLSGNPKVVFDNLKPLRLKISNQSNQQCIGTACDKRYTITTPRSDEIGADEIILIPKQDPKGLYQWVDMYKIDPETGNPVGEAVFSARMITGLGFLEGGRFEAGKQALYDFANGKRSFDDLLPIKLKKDTDKNAICLWATQNQQVYLHFSVKSDLKTGDELELIPVKEEDGTVIFRLMHDDIELGTYGFDRQTKKITIIQLHDVRTGNIQSKGHLLDYSVNKKDFSELTPIRLKVGNNAFGNINILSRGKIRLSISPSRFFDLSPGDEIELIPVEEIEGQAVFAFTKDGQILGHYRYDRQSTRFYRYDKPEKPPESEDISKANDYLRGLVFGEEEI